jgi:hypothetical protein
VKDLERVSRATGRILQDPGVWLATVSLGSLVAAGSVWRGRRAQRRIVQAVVLLALTELAWHGFALIRVAPASTWMRRDTIGEALSRLAENFPGGGPIRVRARDSFFLDLQAVRYGIEKTNVNDVFQVGHASAVYETLYPVATTMAQHPETPMSVAIADNNRLIRRGVFDRMAVSYLVSDRVETDPGWPVAATGSCDGRQYVIQRNPTALPCAYVVPRAKVATAEAGMTLAEFRTADPRLTVPMIEDPLADLPAGERQPFTPARWLSKDPDRPVLEVTTRAPGLLVIADTWMPGWTASVDGRSTTIFRGNHAQRVIALESAGHHVIKLEYGPPGLAAGCLISALSVLAWGTACGLLRLGERRGSMSVLHRPEIQSIARRLVRAP